MPVAMQSNYIHGSSQTERERLALMNELINDRCLSALNLDGERRVLDVGAGTGLFTCLMAESLPPDSSIVAVERDPEQLEAALRNIDSSENGCPVDFRVGDAMDLPLEKDEPGSFDLAHTRFLLEHVPDPGAVVINMVSALRPGGRIVLLDDDHDLMRFWPEPQGLGAAWRAYWRSYYRLETDPLVGRKLTSLLHRAGANPVRIDYLFYGACAGSAEFSGIVDNLLGVLQGARHTVLSAGEISAEKYDLALENFEHFKSLPDAAVWYVINLAEGCKPSENSQD
jgi:ubiquinone/menaquinone biosynthesis C-methylase UbiE